MQADKRRYLYLSVFICGSLLFAQSKHPVTGRVIAPVMGWQGADWLERPERAREENTAAAVEALEIEPHMVVADVGAGSGYYTERLARKAAKVYATDIQPQMLELLKKRKLSNVELALATPDDPKLPANSLDLILMVDVYHELAQPQAMLRKLRQALKPDGRLVLLEFRKEDPSVPIRLEHKMTVEEARTEVEAEGYRLERVDGRLPWQHILIFRRLEVADCASVLRQTRVAPNTIAVECHVNPSLNRYVELAASTGKITRELLGYGFTRSPDGARIAYAGRIPHFAPPYAKSNYLEVDQAVIYPRPKEIAQRGPAYTGIHEFSGGLHWSPDSRRIALIDCTYDWTPNYPAALSAGEGKESNRRCFVVAVSTRGEAAILHRFNELPHGARLEWSDSRRLVLDSGGVKTALRVP
jgi:SAM-dependent methyltransferase